MKKKVYISKSNQANPEELIFLRDLFKSQNIQVIEYLGGDYNEFIQGVFKETSALINISHPGALENDKAYLGNGTLTEAYNAMKENNLIYFYNGNFFKVKDVHSLPDDEKDWKRRSGWLEVNLAPLLIMEVLSEIAGEDVPDLDSDV